MTKGKKSAGVFNKIKPYLKTTTTKPGGSRGVQKGTKVQRGLGLGNRKYKRPKGYRKGVRDQAWNNAKKQSHDGKVRDPLTSKVMDKNKPWDMGHKPGHEFWKHRDDAAGRGASRKQFLDEHNNPNSYVPELPSSNQGHSGEDHTNWFYGP